MDFKSLISKLDSMEAPPETPRAPRLPEKIQLNEDAELRVLAGTSTILAESELMEKKLTKAEKAKKEEVVKSMKDDTAGFKERYGKRGEEVMHATATKIAKKKAESVESKQSTLSEAPLDMNLFTTASEKGMGGRKSDAESDRNIGMPYGYRGPDGSEDRPAPFKPDLDVDYDRAKAERILAQKVRSPEDIDSYIMPLVYKKHKEISDQDFENVAEKLIAMARTEDLNDPSDKFYKSVGDAVVNPIKFLGKKPIENSSKNHFRDKFLSLVEAKKKEAAKTVKGKKAKEKMDENSNKKQTHDEQEQEFQDFIARGGKVTYGTYKEPSPRARLRSMGSRHIGGRAEIRSGAGRRVGISANKDGKTVISNTKMDEDQAPTYNVIDGAGKSVGTFRDGAGFMPGPNAKAKGLKAGPTVPNGYKVDYKSVVEGKKSGKKKPDADGDRVPDWADKKPGEDDNADKKTAGKKATKGMTAKQAKYFGKKKTVKESNDIDEFFHYGKGGGFDDDDDYPDTGEGPEDLLDAVESEIKNPGQRIDNLVDVLNATFGSDKSPEFEKARRIIEKYIELVTTADMDHYDDDDDDRTNPAISAMDHDDIQRHIREYDLTDRLVHAAAMLEKIIAKGESYQFRESANAKKKSKKYIKESVEPKMTFRDLMKLVVESGGQQQIDPLDKALFSWATRVAKNKLGEGKKAEVYAGLVYERMGGRFEMYDVLSENKK